MLKVSFAGQREDRNNVDKLRYQTNALNFNNQRNIKNSINNLSKDSSTKNINFLMNVADQIKYGLNANVTDVKPNNDWKEYLKKATEKSLSHNNTKAKESLQARFKEVFENNKTLTDEERNVLSLRESLLNTNGLKNAIETSDNHNVKNIEKNLNYFVVSSEITTDEKVQVLEKLNKFMNPEYKVQKQLENKKPQILGEMLNDLVVKTAEQDMPIIKQVDQRFHGMCAAISIARKQMAYEFKPQYVDIVMQEVSADDTMEVFDISKLGTGAKVRVPKTEIDYDYADEKGYRIIDAATLNWMNIAGTTGRGDVETQHFSAFDRKYFDTFHDNHYFKDFENPLLNTLDNHLRALNKANETVSSTVKNFEKMKQSAKEQYLTAPMNTMLLSSMNDALAKNLSELMPNADEKTINSTVNELTHLNKGKEKEFYIVDAEEDITKKQKIANFIKSKNPQVSTRALNSKLDTIFELYKGATEVIEYSEKAIIPRSPEAKMTKYYKPLYKVAATYRSAVDLGLDFDNDRQLTAQRLGLPENATKEQILTELENKGEIVKESVLRSLQTRFNKIAKNEAVVEQAEVKGQKIKDKTLYDISKEEVLALENVNKNLKDIQKLVKKETEILQEVLWKPLKERAAQVGLENGRYWVSEGHSGLNTPQQIRIFEQMTGNRFSSDKDLDTLVNYVKNSEHSAVSATNVYHNDVGGHAMYVADVVDVNVKNPKTGKMEPKTAIMHDNTWGYAEKKNNWIDSNGLERTDYACGRGGETGYITNALWQNGTLVDDFKTKLAAIKDSDGSVEKSRMFWDSVMMNPDKTDISEHTANFVNTVLGRSNEYLVMLDALTGITKAYKGLKTDDFEELKQIVTSVDEYNSFSKNYYGKIWNKVKSEEEWNNINPSDNAKFLMEKAATILSMNNNKIFANLVKEAKTPKDLESINKKEKSMVSAYLAATIQLAQPEDFDFNNYQMGNYDGIQTLKGLIDDIYKPSSNEDFINVLNKLKSMKKRDLQKELTEKATDEQLGINKKSSYEVMNDYRNLDPTTKKVVEDVLLHNAYTTVGCESNAANIYRNLYLSLSNLDISDQIKSFEKTAYKNYKALPAFPEYSVYSEKASANAAMQVLAIAGNLQELYVIKDTEKGQETIQRINKALNDNIDACIAKHYRNDAKHILNQYLSAMHKINTSKDITEEDLNKYQEKIQNIVDSFVNIFVKHAITKDMKAVLNEYVEALIDKNESKAATLKQYLEIACEKAAGYKVQEKFMEANIKGNAHEFGQEILNTPMGGIDKNGNKFETLPKDDPLILQQIAERIMDLTGIGVAATIINGIGLADKIMESFVKTIDFKTILKTITPELKNAIINDTKNKFDFVKKLNLSQFPEAAKLRNIFAKQVSDFIKQVKVL